MLSGWEVSLQIPTVVSHHDYVPVTLIPGLHHFQVLMESLPLLVTHWTQVLGNVKIGSVSWRSCCSPGFWKQSACCWQVLHSFWPCCCQESSSLSEQMPSTLPVPLCSLSFWTLDLWWATRSEDRQRCQLSTSPWSILEKPGTSKLSSHHPCPEPWWTA